MSHSIIHHEPTATFDIEESDAHRNDTVRGDSTGWDANDKEMIDATSSVETAPSHPLDVLAAVITREGLPEGSAKDAPAWVDALARFGGAMDALLELHTCRLLPSWYESGARLCIENPADARRLVADLDALAARSSETSDFYSSLALAQAVETAARDAAMAAVSGIEADLAQQVEAIRRLREDARSGERCVRDALESIAVAATASGRVTVSVVTQALRATLETAGGLDGAALRRSFYSAVIAAASAFGARQPPRLAEASSVGFDALQRMRASPGPKRALEILSRHDLGMPLLGAHSNRGYRPQ